MDAKVIDARITELLNIPWFEHESAKILGEMLPSTITILEAVYGRDCGQMKELHRRIGSAKQTTYLGNLDAQVHGIVEGALKSVRGDIRAGLIGSISRTVTGEVISDLLLMANHEIEERGESAKDVAAVLVAAAYEDTIRRMGEVFCGISTRPPLSDVVIALKDNKILIGSLVGTVQSQLQFRNHALHAEWNKIDLVSVKTVLSLVQELLLKHFS